ncbi:AraC family transcriptional regulator [Aestuariivivens sp. NBU2969]|uniref:AraC family transcriptional regulator n=1 Tax=Aestuariivivens sp. NBU2969 TaxID=2873267 RepID=UPI001CC17215|nr:AraC family transcriptional regulator [Aestuariivivens sp. NBU2969]
MEIFYEKIPFPINSSLRARNIKIQHFTIPLHQHEELEIVYVLKSFGKKYIGDSIKPFKKGDLVLIGSRLPHTWKNDEIFYNNKNYTTQVIVIQFPTNIIDYFSNYHPELFHISKMLNSSTRGISFGNKVADKNHSLLISLCNSSGFDKIMKFTQLLHNLSVSEDFEFLASLTFKNLENNSFKRITQTLDFISHNFKKQIYLDDLASNFNMSKSAFCNYFKRKTGNTVISYINELRISFACKLLIESDKNIIEIAYDSGFNNISNFNRAFRVIIGKTPREYRTLWSKSN